MRKSSESPETSSCFLTPGTSETSESATGGYGVARRWQTKGYRQGPLHQAKKTTEKLQNEWEIRGRQKQDPIEEWIKEHTCTLSLHCRKCVLGRGDPLFSNAQKLLWLSQLWKRELCQGGRAGILVNWPTGDFLWVQFLHLVESSYSLLCVATVFVYFATYFLLTASSKIQSS